MANEIKFYGINETLFFLKNYEKELYKQITSDLEGAAKPLADLVGSRFPDMPLLNWHSSGGRVGKKRFPPYISAKARSGVKAKSGGTTRRNAQGNRAILRIEQTDAGGQVFDSAGKGTYESTRSTLIQNLDKHTTVKSIRGKNRSRVMFGAVNANKNLVEKAVEKVVETVDKQTTQRINSQGTR
jgi:hypothetical protein